MLYVRLHFLLGFNLSVPSMRDNRAISEERQFSFSCDEFQTHWSIFCQEKSFIVIQLNPDDQKRWGAASMEHAKRNKHGVLEWFTGQYPTNTSKAGVTSRYKHSVFTRAACAECIMRANVKSRLFSSCDLLWDVETNRPFLSIQWKEISTRSLQLDNHFHM